MLNNQNLQNMLSCKCGWLGVNLKPSTHDNTARCPSCGNIFQGFTADTAIAVSSSEEEKIVNSGKAFVLLAEKLFPSAKET